MQHYARRATPEDVYDAVLAGAWVIDLRAQAAYAEGHVPGSVSLEYTDQFATYAGWLVPWGDDIVLLTDSADVLEPALRDLARIGLDDVGARVLTSDDSLTATYRRSDWTASARRSASRSRSWSTYARSTSGTTATCLAPSTCRFRMSSGSRPGSPVASCGFTAGPATGPASRPACCTGWATPSCTSTTPGTG